MENLASPFLSILRDRNTTRRAFREATESLVHTLAHRAAHLLPKETYTLQTPLASTEGVRFAEHVILAPILRSGLAMLPGFQDLFRDAAVAFLGFERDEKTALPHLYYSNIPKLTKKEHFVILDPMLATGGTAVGALEILTNQGIPEQQILFAAVVAAPEGIAHVQERFPGVELLIAATDDHLNSQKYIVPGLGDFGDRYFGTE